MFTRLLLILMFLFATKSSLANEVLRVAVVPQFSTMEVAKAWSPLLARLETLTGVSLELVSYADIPTFEKAILKGSVDIAYMNPYHAVMAFEAQGYVPHVRDQKLLTGILLVHKDSNVRALEDLNHQTIAFPSPNAFGASLWMRALLTNNHHLAFSANYVGTHQNVFRKVAMGEFIAGGAVNATLQKEPDSIKDALRVIYTTPGVAPHPIAIHPRVNNATARRISDALLAMSEQEEDRKLLSAVQITTPVLADYAKDYAPLKSLNIQSFVQ